MALVGWSLAYSTETGTYWLPVAKLEPAEPDLLTEPALQSLSRAQLDGDVDPDLLGVVDMKGGTLLHTWRGPVAESLGTVAIAGNYPHSIAADVNGDGLSEAVVAGDGQVLVLSNAPGSPDAFGCIGESLVSHAAYFMEAGDWDGESGDEVVVSDGEVLTLLHHNGKGE